MPVCCGLLNRLTTMYITHYMPTVKQTIIFSMHHFAFIPTYCNVILTASAAATAATAAAAEKQQQQQQHNQHFLR